MELNSTQQNRRTTEKRNLTLIRAGERLIRETRQGLRKTRFRFRENGEVVTKTRQKKSALLVQMLKGNPPLQSFPKLLLILALNHGQKPLSSSRLLEKTKPCLKKHRSAHEGKNLGNTRNLKRTTTASHTHTIVSKPTIDRLWSGR